MTGTGAGNNEVTHLHAEIAKAVAAFDWDAVRRSAGDLADLLRAADELDPKIMRVLKLLLNNRQYGPVMHIADAALAIAPGDRALWRQYAQTLVDQGRTAPALRIYADITEDREASADDQLEAGGGIGRCYKELLLVTTDSVRRVEYLRRAVKAYMAPYRADRERYWHGINAAALLAYADRKSMAVKGIDDVGQASIDIAAHVLSTVSSSDDPWAPVTACEAHIALGDVEQALVQADIFVSDDATKAFMIASFLRQLEKVWEIEPESLLGTTLLPLLRSELVKKSGGIVTLTGQDVTRSRLDALDQVGSGGAAEGLNLEKVFGADRFQTLQWWRTGLLRCRAVVRIDDTMGVGRGTGFVVRGADLHHSLPATVVVTNGHVVPEAIVAADTRVTFRGLETEQAQPPRFEVRKVHWYSPSIRPDVDTTVLELEADGLPPDVEPIPIVDRFPVLTEESRTYIIGHPRGYDQPQFSLQDNLFLACDETRLHYRTPTEGGSSGSPVFDDQWKVIGLHHAGSLTLSKLTGKGAYSANEALRIDAIRTALGKCLTSREA